jgi:hypothetical protein
VTAIKGQPGQDIPEITARRGQPGNDNQDKTTRKGQPEKTSGKYSQEQNSQDRTAKKGQPGPDRHINYKITDKICKGNLHIATKFCKYGQFFSVLTSETVFYKYFLLYPMDFYNRLAAHP